MHPSPHIDTYARDSLPPRDQWPVLQFDLAELHYPEALNAAQLLLDDAIAEGHAAAPALHHGDRTLTYADLLVLTDSTAHTLTAHGVRPGDRVLLRGANTPELFAAWLAVLKTGAIAVPTMPMLRRLELVPILAKARVTVALCEPGLEAELATAIAEAAPTAILLDLNAAAQTSPVHQPFAAVATRADDIALIAFTSGTTGTPKAALHFHRDILAMADSFARHILVPGPASIFTGTPPIAFTFGLGALLVFPLRFRGAASIPDMAGPDALAHAVQRHRATHIFTSPTGYRAILARRAHYDLTSLRASVSAGEHLNPATWNAWHEATGLNMIEGIGATEMIHIFVSAPAADARPGRIGRAVPGYTAALMAADGSLIEGAGEGRLAVRGPTGCRYMSDPRQADYVVDGWNVTGDLFRRDAEGWLSYVARADEMIVSSGYNISGAEIEAVLTAHPHVHECAVLGVPDAERGQIVKAVIVAAAHAPEPALLAKALQDHAKAVLAPYKYPRLIEFRTTLPRTPNGKVQRHALRTAP